MMNVKIKIGRVGDTVLFPEQRNATECELITVGILEHGTVEGNTSLVFTFKEKTANFTSRNAPR